MNIHDRLFLETDDSCAICGARGIKILTVHHIDNDHSHNTYDNQIILCHNCHIRYHQNKGLPEVEIKNRKGYLIEKTLTTYGLNALKIANRNDFGVIAMPFLLYHIVDLGYMTKEEDQMGYGKQNDAAARFAITESGRSLLQMWFI
jgi:hypothetical protein